MNAFPTTLVLSLLAAIAVLVLTLYSSTPNERLLEFCRWRGYTYVGQTLILCRIGTQGEQNGNTPATATIVTSR